MYRHQKIISAFVLSGFAFITFQKFATPSTPIYVALSLSTLVLCCYTIGVINSKYRRVAIFSYIVASLYFLILGRGYEQFTALGATIIATCGVATAYYLSPNNKLKTLPFVRQVVLTTIWCVILFVLPSTLENVKNDIQWWVVGAGAMLIMATTIPFEMRDVQYDAANNQINMGAFLTKKQTQALYLSCIIGCIIFSWAAYNSVTSNNIFFASLIACALHVLCFTVTNKNMLQQYIWFDVLLLLWSWLL